LSDVEVMAIGQTYRKAPGTTSAVPVSSITVAVGPQETQKLIKAIAASKLYVSLRSDKDRRPVATMDITTLYGKPAPPANDITAEREFRVPAPPLFSQPKHAAPAVVQPEPVAPATHDIETWSGSKRDVVSLLSSKTHK